MQSFGSFGAVVTAAAMFMPPPASATTGESQFAPTGQAARHAYDFQLSGHQATFVNGIFFGDPAASVTHAIPAMAIGLNLAAAEVLGPIGVERFAMFSNLDDGWAGDGQAMRFESVQALNAFFNEGIEFATSPSLFLLKDGSLQVVGESTAGGALEFDFHPDGVYFYSESAENEGYVEASADGFRKLASLVQEQAA